MAKAAVKAAKTNNNGSENSMVGKIKSDFPKHNLEEAAQVAIALSTKNGGRPLPPIEMAQALGMSPGSSDFRIILSSSLKYGLTSGSYKQDRIAQESLGRRLAEPISPEDRHQALVTAALTPETFRLMYDYYKGKKLPDQQFFENTVVREFSIPREHATKCVELFTKNMDFVGLTKNLPSGKWLSTEAVAPATERNDDVGTEEVDPDVDHGTQTPPPVLAFERSTASSPQSLVKGMVDNKRVFIAHGKNREIVQQLKDLLSFGDFEPIVSVEREATAEPIPQKVIKEMRLCAAAVINVAKEQELLDAEGNTHRVLNENVLIEIGAALALYQNNFILLVQKGVHLPSDLQGLNRCDYEGERLDYDATMKLLKTFSLFRKA